MADKKETETEGTPQETEKKPKVPAKKPGFQDNRKSFKPPRAPIQKVVHRGANRGR